MAVEDGAVAEVVPAGEGAVGSPEVLVPQANQKSIWTPERLAKAAATRAETKRKKEERAARKLDTAKSNVNPNATEKVVTTAGVNGYDWNSAPLDQATAKLSDLRKEYDKAAAIVLRRQSVSKPQWICWTQSHKDIVPMSVQKLCRKSGDDGKWAFRDDGVFETIEGLRVPRPAFCCNTYCFEAYQKSKPLSSLSRH
jgi:hypothetical protein